MAPTFYMSLSGLDKQSAVKQVQVLTLCFSCETFTNLSLTAEDIYKSVATIISAIKRMLLDTSINQLNEETFIVDHSSQENPSMITLFH